MSNVWNEKPEAIDIPAVPCYPKSQMDDWLEKLRTHYIGLENGYKSCFESYNELVAENTELKEKAGRWDTLVSSNEAEQERLGIVIEKYDPWEKLEAVKKWNERYAGTYAVEDSYPWEELDEILEIESE